MAVNKRDAAERGAMYARAYVAWVSCIRWSVASRDWGEHLDDGVNFPKTIRDMLQDIRRYDKGLAVRVVMSSRLANAMYNGDFREVFQYDRLLRDYPLAK